MTLLETYSKRLAVSNSVYKKAHSGEELSESKKIAVATVLNNTNKYLTEAFANSVGTQRADLGAWKKFCLNLTTVALPNLISHDLVIVHPMTSISGYITYVQYTAGTDKGETSQGDVFNDPFRLRKPDVNYTSSNIPEAHTATSAEVTAHKFGVIWTPVAAFRGVKIGTTTYTLLTTGTPVADTSVLVDASAGTVTFASDDTKFVADAEVNVLYSYDNVVIPQNDLPIVNAKIQSMPLVAVARRVAVYYSQIAAFQAKTDYGFDLGDQLAEKACGQLAYEIDTEVTNLLIDNATVDADLSFNKSLPYGVSKAEHYDSFTEVIEIGKQKIYDKTGRYAPNYMLIASNVLPILSFVKSFKPAPIGKINGPYFAGTLGGLKVFVTPNIEAGKFVLGVNGDDFMSSAAVYAPYMSVIPTQLLGYSDGGMSQGFSTMYALKLLNADLLIAGTVTNTQQVVQTHTNA